MMAKKFDFRIPKLRWFVIAAIMMTLTAVFVTIWIPYQRTIRLIEDIEAVTSKHLDMPSVTDWSGGSDWSGGPDWLRKLIGDDRMRGFDSILRIDLSDTSIDDQWLMHRINGLSDLETLYLERTQITDEGLRHLANLTKLKELYLADSQITDNGLKHLSNLTGLIDLFLERTQISDEGLKHLIRLTELRRLTLFDTKVTQAGERKLKKALPNCRIY